ncbi:MAG: nuclear transport factor 2 family protein [Gemmatimonadaceae bacterium]|nr:nuclear transport factor 2 family protein [Gemmatimonadaceae bacterium]
MALLAAPATGLAQGRPTTAAHTTDSAAVHATVEAWWAAWATADTAAVDSLHTDDYAEFSEGSRRYRYGRTAMRDGALRYFARRDRFEWRLSDVRVQLADAVAVVTYQYEERRGSAISRGASTDVLRRVGGRWRYWAHHATTFPAR